MGNEECDESAYCGTPKSNDMPTVVETCEPNEVTLAAIAAENGGDMYGPFESVSDLMEALNEECKL